MGSILEAPGWTDDRFQFERSFYLCRRLQRLFPIVIIADSNAIPFLAMRIVQTYHSG